MAVTVKVLAGLQLGLLESPRQLDEIKVARQSDCQCGELPIPKLGRGKTRRFAAKESPPPGICLFLLWQNAQGPRGVTVPCERTLDR